MATFSSLQAIDLLSLFSFIILILIFIGFKWIPFYRKPKKNLPPSPRKLPIIGNFHQLGSSPHRSLQALSQKHGPLMLLHLGTVRMLVASTAEAAREIIKTHDLSFSGRPNITLVNIVFYGPKDIAFSSYGEQWRQLKSIAVTHVLSKTRVKSFRQVREEEIGLMMDNMLESHGSSVDLGAMFVTLANNIVCKATVGRSYHDLTFTSLLKKLADILDMFTVGSYIPWLWWVDRLSGIIGKTEKIAKELDEFLEGVIEEHVNKKSKTTDTKGDEVQDMVDILLDVQRDNTNGFILTRDSLKALILDIFAGGTDTVSSSLEWAVSELVRHPRVMKKLQQEVTQIAQGKSMILEEDLEKMQYLKAVVKESFRLHPAFPLIPRESTQDVQLMGYDIPAGTQVMINVWTIGRDPALWDEPWEFRPERFLNNSIDYKRLHDEFIAFGSGRRGCPGTQFAIVAMELAIANVVYKFDLAPPNGVENKDLDMSESSGFTVHKKSSLLVTASSRF